MFRVIYEWRVPTGTFGEFYEAWVETTQGIHNSVEGAMGSFMLRSPDDPEKVLTIAKWSSSEAWQAFFANRDPRQMHKMRTLAERVSVQGYSEIEDQTL